MKKRIYEIILFSILIIILSTSLTIGIDIDKTKIELTRWQDFEMYYKITLDNPDNEVVGVDISTTEDISHYAEISKRKIALPPNGFEQFYVKLNIDSQYELSKLLDPKIYLTIQKVNGIEKREIPIIISPTIEFPKKGLLGITAFGTLGNNNNAVQSVNGDSNDNQKLLRSMIIILILVIGTLGTYYNYQYLKKKYAIPPLRKVNLSLLSFIINQLMKNKSPEEITAKLLQNNWNEVLVKQHFDIALAYKFNVSLIKYIANAKKKAMSTQEIRKNLVNNNWGIEIIEKHLHLLEENPNFN